MRIQLSEIADLVGGRLVRENEVLICGASPPEEAVAGELTLLDDPRRASLLEQSHASAVVTTSEIKVALPQIIVDDAHQAFAKIVACFRPPVDTLHLPTGIHPEAIIDETAFVHPSAVIGAGVRIGARTQIYPGVVVMPQATIGDDCVLHAGVTLYEYTTIADRVVIHAGSVLGAHGFGYRQQAGRHMPTAQLGYVQIDSDVELGACVTIDRGTYGSTRIGEGTKIDNQVMIGHNCQIGRHNLICSQVGIAGSCRTGDYVVLAGQVGLKDHVTLGDQAIVGAQAGVMEDCESNQIYLGSPATVQKEQMQIMAVQRRLPEMRRELKDLRRQLDRLSQLTDKSHENRKAA